MTDQDAPQTYLISPPDPDPASFAHVLARLLDAEPVACFRLTMPGAGESDLRRAADSLRDVAHVRDVPLVIDTHYRLVEPLGLDGVHLPDGGRELRRVRAALGAEAIVGAHCGASRHAGLSAGEAGADYIAFGPVAETALGSGVVAHGDLFAWWSEMIELPVVAEGGLTPALVERLAPVADFFAIGPEIWGADDPLAALRQLRAPLG